MTDDITAHMGALGPSASGPMFTRRQALRAGALAGAVVWTAPVVQVLTMSPAAADSTSAPRGSKPKHPGKPHRSQKPHSPKPSNGNGYAYGRD